MPDGDFDNTNSGVFFMPHADQQFVGQGRLNIEGKDLRIVVVKEKLSRDGAPLMVLYQRLGPLFDNDKSRSGTPETAPDKGGPLDDWPDHRIVGWKGEKNGRRYMSLRVLRREAGGG